ncbi:MAG: tetratricopeptide repeat protein, partial [Pseudomonadota bacterium]|nr:tetratricopeptide repeat protein [Pseudomonadota bacterium]
SLALEPDNAHGAHIRAHVYYEAGETKAGFEHIEAWHRQYDPSAQLHCHVSWHVALWAMELGDTARMWAIYDADLTPPIDRPGKWGPPINLLTDGVALFYRASLNGVDIAPARWQALSAYADRFFAKPGIAFADVHAALAHAMAGNIAAVDTIVTSAAGPAAPVVRTVASAAQALAAGDGCAVTDQLTPLMAEHERLGGSRAQRDLVDYMLVSSLLERGQVDEARRLIAMRRPLKAHDAAIARIH